MARGNGTVVLTARLGGDVLAIERMDLTKPKERTGFIAALGDGRFGSLTAQAGRRRDGPIRSNRSGT